MKRVIWVATFCMLLPAWFVWAEEKGKEDFYSQLNSAIIRLEHFVSVQQEGLPNAIKQNKPDGTAFFVKSGKGLFVVSARHVVEQPYDLHARVECLNMKSGQKEVIFLKLPRNRWVFHSESGDKDTHPVDVAAMQIKWIKNRAIRCFSYEPPESEAKDKNQLPSADPLPPRRILVFGFPLDIGFKLLEQRPLGRSGIIAMKTGKKFLRMNYKGVDKFAEERCYVIDVKAFPGNSGSPIMNEPSQTNPRIQLLGLLSATSQKMDFAVVEPVSRIREVLDLARDQKNEDINFWLVIKIKTEQPYQPDAD
ncbi:MAG: trypsin-like peptidase domain-containing protein [Pseudomonadota bacterium]